MEIVVNRIIWYSSSTQAANFLNEKLDELTRKKVLTFWNAKLWYLQMQRCWYFQQKCWYFQQKCWYFQMQKCWYFQKKCWYFQQKCWYFRCKSVNIFRCQVVEVKWVLVCVPTGKPESFTEEGVGQRWKKKKKQKPENLKLSVSCSVGGVPPLAERCKKKKSKSDKKEEEEEIEQ